MEVAVLAVQDAVAAARFVARSYSTNFEEGTLGKVDASPVTVADFAVQAIICKRLLDAFPNDLVIGVCLGMPHTEMINFCTKLMNITLHAFLFPQGKNKA